MDKVLFLEKGKTKTMSPTVLPANASNKRVTWLSYNSAVVSVSNGTVLGVSAGRTTITATTEDGRLEVACTVTVVTEIPDIDDMVWINPGTFMMGSPYDEPDNYENETQHQVTLTEGFYMGKYPVTQRQFLDVMGYNPSYYPTSYSTLYVDRWEEFPVESIYWYEAILYCNKLSQNEDLAPVYTMYKETAPNANSSTPNDPEKGWEDTPENWSTDPEDWGELSYASLTRWNLVRMVPYSTGYRLPTEAEWEDACRAGTTTPFNTYRPGEANVPPTYGPAPNPADPPIVTDPGYNYDGYNITTNQASWYGFTPYNGNVQGVYLNQPVPVSMYEESANTWGLLNMHGNIEEWCWDWYGSYRYSTSENPTGPDTGTSRVTRGGSFWDAARDLRSAVRSSYPPSSYPTRVGFRVIRSYSWTE
jgi:formylglycine-generating enzyme required for sulfatase activity